MSAARKLTKGEATRRDLLASGARIFGRVGYVKAEISMVIADAGRGRGTFYVYFTDKADLLRAMVHEYQTELLDLGLEPTLPFSGTVDELIAALWRNYKQYMSMFRALAQAATVDASFAELFAEFRSFARRDLQALVVRAQPDRPDDEAKLIAEALEIMLINCMYEWLPAEGETPLSSAAEEKAFRVLVGLIAGGVTSPPPAS